MRNSTYEIELSKQGVKWEYLQAITLDFVNEKKGLQNQARLEQVLDEPTVAQYEQVYRESKETYPPPFPPLVVHRPGQAKLVPLDGNQRYAAAVRAGLKKHDAYLVKSADPMVLDRIAWSFNNHVNGLRLTQAECVEHATTFVRKYGWTQKDAAKEWGCPYKDVEKKCKVHELREKIAEYKVKAGPAVTDDVLYNSSTVATLGDDIFIPFVRAVSDTGSTGTDAKELALRVRNGKTRADRLAEIEAFVSSDRATTRRAETKGGTVRRPSPLPRDRLAKLIGEGLRLVVAYPDRKAFLPGNKPELKKMRIEAADLVRHLNIIFGLGTVGQVEEGVA